MFGATIWARLTDAGRFPKNDPFLHNIWEVVKKFIQHVVITRNFYMAAKSRGDEGRRTSRFALEGDKTGPVWPKATCHG